MLRFSIYEDLQFFYGCQSLKYVSAFMQKFLIFTVLKRDLCMVAAEDLIVREINQVANSS